MALAIGAVQVEKGARQCGCVRGREPQVGQRRGGVAEDRVGQRLAHVADKAFVVAGGQFRHVETEFLRQRQHHPCRHRAVVVFHLVEIGQRDAKFRRERLLRQADAVAHLAQLRAGVELLRGHG